MSLLDAGQGFEPCTVYLEEVSTDDDGNTLTRPSATGIPAKARFQIQGQSGTSSRRAEQQEEGFETERVYTVRFPRGFPILGAQSQIGWGTDSEGREARWSIFGDVQRYNSSRRTRHVVYTIRRS
ncbi:hypothetical protein [Mycobacterium intracellulare]|uniref:Head-to-tail stopper n=1 Tax=Mycobacterium intracellulare TaxID=1767 RepID=A0AAE4UCH9_MYCIT|nr:hypothetical protein [Mycobacterium intracellulare]MDV6975335.1 hypothetical protein [Mycobacterium intracellulare]MDV6980399.1 hypothetical protein [Mycobacterium intracellulare]MDV7010828.1 hypothetical protein [Mycobacterium intracellulare]MDV7025734.1 hypothetical protein [Mycobacterium intracellulare]